MGRVYNFSAGPAVLPEEVLRDAAAEMLDYNGSGMSVMEMSHRSKVYEEIIEEAEVQIKYGGYIERERLIADKTNRLEYVNIPSDINYDALQSLSTEAKQKLKKHLPKTIGQASRISGVSPSDINTLIVLVGR